MAGKPTRMDSSIAAATWQLRRNADCVSRRLRIRHTRAYGRLLATTSPSVRILNMQQTVNVHVPLATSRSATGIPTGRLAVWWVLASEIVIFGGLIVCYI